MKSVHNSLHQTNSKFLKTLTQERSGIWIDQFVTQRSFFQWQSTSTLKEYRLSHYEAITPALVKIPSIRAGIIIYLSK
jgi:hypothetical protein